MSIIVLIFVFFLCWVGFLWKVFKSGVAGSYPHAETWRFKINESRLLEVIEEIRQEHPELNDTTSINYDSTNDSPFHYIIFYYSDTRENVQTWIRAENDTNYTTFAFVAISKKFDSSLAKDNFKIERKEINSDFGYFKNKAEIKKFELRIVKLIELKLSQKD